MYDKDKQPSPQSLPLMENKKVMMMVISMEDDAVALPHDE